MEAQKIAEKELAEASDAAEKADSQREVRPPLCIQTV